MNIRRARVLAGDVGGTHTRLAVYDLDDGALVLLRRETYASSEHGCLADIVARFVGDDEIGRAVDAACLGVPAPIHPGIVRLTNLPWRIDREQISQAIGTERIALINDVQASAAGIESLADEDRICLQRGDADPAGNRVVISVGTGFGVSALTPSGRTFATEAGHATFSPIREGDYQLQAVLKREHGHVSWERVASGSALPTLHSVLAPDGSPRLGAAEIVRRSKSDLACKKTLETFRRYIGAAAGNVALTLMATGGLYLAGGVAPKVLDESKGDEFLEAFLDKGRMRALLERMPVYLVREDGLALRGAARTAIGLLSEAVPVAERVVR